MKIRMTRTTVIEYDPNPENYGTNDYNEMLKIDLECFDEDPDLTFMSNIVSDTVVGELVE